MRDMRKACSVLVLGILVPLFSSCVGTGAPDAARLARLPPLPFRIALCGGALLSPDQRSKPQKMADVEDDTILALRTYAGVNPEPIAFRDLSSLLERGRLGTVLLPIDAKRPNLREKAALESADSAAAIELRRKAEARGADLLLVVHGIRDAPVIQHGVNSQWPISSIAWLLVGLGMFIPDHRFESQAHLLASIRDAHSGAVLYDNLVISAGAMDLALVERTDWLGIVESLIVPPPLVGNDPESVVETVREESNIRMLLQLLALLKTPETLERIRAAQPFRLVLEEEAPGRVLVRVRSQQEIQAVTIEVGSERHPLPRQRRDAFLVPFLSSGRRSSPGEAWIYRGTLDSLAIGSEVRVLISTVAGERVSSTLRLSGVE